MSALIGDSGVGKSNIVSRYARNEFCMDHKPNGCFCVFAVVMIGDSGVGKSNIVSRYAGNEFRTDHTPTTGVDFTSTR